MVDPDARQTYQDSDPPPSAQGHGTVGEPGAYAELSVLLEQAIRHLESSDFRSAGAKLERVCNTAASLWDADEPPGFTEPRTPQIRHADVRLVSRGQGNTPRPMGPGGT